MIGWLLANLATICVCAVLLFLTALIVIRLVKNKKSGKTACGCGCAGCGMSGHCHH